MTEKRQGQDLVRLYLPVELKERFKLYCQLKGATMTEVIKEQIEELLANTEMTDLLKQRLSGDRNPASDRTDGSAPETKK
jgi:predicted DNA-binding protein